MSYTGSLSQVGAGVTIGIGGTPTLIGEVTDITRSGAQMGTVASTNLNSLSEEFIRTLLKPGSVDVTYNRYAADAGQILIETDFNAGTVSSFTITLPKTAAQTTSGDKVVFSALIEEFDDISSIKAENIIVSKIKLKVQGGASATPWVRTAGS